MNFATNFAPGRSRRLLPVTFSLLLLFTLQVSAQWNQTSGFPAGPTDGSWSFVIGDKAYVGGGIAASAMYVFDGSTATWSTPKALPDSKLRAWAFAFTHNGKGYVGGGDTTAGFTVTNEFYEYDPETDTWKELAPFGPGARDGCFAFVLGDKAYVGGGFDGTYINSDVWEYDFANNTWAVVGAYPGGPVIFPSSFTIGGEAYVVGGAGQVEMQSMFAFNPATKTWTEERSFPGTARQAGAAFAMGGKGYYGGGMAAYSTTFTDVWSYDADKNEWAQAASYPTNSTAWPVAFVVGNQAYYGTGAAFAGQGLTFSGQFFSFSLSSSGVQESGWTEGMQRVEMQFSRATNRVRFTLPNDRTEGTGALVIRDMQGRIVEQGELELRNGVGEIEAGRLGSGVYFCSIGIDGTQIAGKLLLQR